MRIRRCPIRLRMAQHAGGGHSTDRVRSTSSDRPHVARRGHHAVLVLSASLPVRCRRTDRRRSLHVQHRGSKRGDD
uniref:Uncharacterized protein n=1 Tax=uncultured marine virus TaxID=186617 RepID=A0A0F7L7A8_9VIRU|nr:hypothetical protein [uncultured marine virus]